MFLENGLKKNYSLLSEKDIISIENNNETENAKLNKGNKLIGDGKVEILTSRDLTPGVCAALGRSRQIKSGGLEQS